MANKYGLKIDGLEEWQGAIRALQSKMPKAVTAAFNAGADVVVNAAQADVPRRSGKAARSIRAKSSPAGMSIVAGGRDAEYFPWLDYGGRVGRKKKTKRQFFREGRYIWPNLRAKLPAVRAAVVKALGEAARAEGLEVS